MTDQQTTIIAVLDEEVATDAVIQRATDRGLHDGARVVLYDVSATASPLESPLPTEFASEGPDRGVSPLLTAEDLEAAGQAPLAHRVRALSEAGIDAYGWLPDTDKTSDLADYARRIGATRVIAPGPLDGIGEELRGSGLDVEAVP
jgi:nucleotide-binding universal stress UspA family protein